ncbi:MAG: heme ABC transporter ATP-binding protein [Acetobacteraceae bacterium]
MIQADRIGVRIGARHLLDGVSLCLEPGTLTAVLGRNGAGKTTLLRAMTGDLAPDTGTVLLDGMRLHALAPRDLARRRAVLSQHHGLAFGLSVADVVALGRLPHRGTAAARHDRDALAAVCAAFELEALWQRAYPTLSGGERQRVHLARAAAQLWRPGGDHAGQALFLDEPAAALDLAQQRFALRFARDMARRGTMVMAVLHDPNHAADADQVVMLRDGQVAAIGEAAAVLTAANIAHCFGVTVETVERADGRRVFVA